jgi:hypothetical protein
MVVGYKIWRTYLILRETEMNETLEVIIISCKNFYWTTGLYLQILEKEAEEEE